MKTRIAIFLFFLGFSIWAMIHGLRMWGLS